MNNLSKATAQLVAVRGTGSQTGLAWVLGLLLFGGEVS